MEDNVDKILKKIKAVINKYKVIFICVVILTSIIVIYKYIKNDQDIINISNVYKEDSNGIQQKDNNKYENKTKIIVHIDGQVINKGVYTIESDSRLNDLIALAGGLTEQADVSKINLAKKLNDGEKIYIYATGEEIITQENNYEDEENNEKININTANKNQLKTLPGIGDSIAEKIISYREKKGKFESIEDIQKVNGIGSSKFNSIKDLISI